MDRQAEANAAGEDSNIVVDQFHKVVTGEPSVLSPGMWPFSDNLLYKNLSYEEVKVIAKDLYPSQYYDVFKCYYDTYRFSVPIGDDGERNAKRHAFWSICMKQTFGEKFAKGIGNAHERGCPGTKLDNCVDVLNNKAALQYAKFHPGVHPATAANQMWSRGLLYDYNSTVKENCHFLDVSEDTRKRGIQFGYFGLPVVFFGGCVCFLIVLLYVNLRNLYSGTRRRCQFFCYQNGTTENKKTT